MPRLIDADALKEYIHNQDGRPFIGITIGKAFQMMVDEQPTIEERKKGEWIDNETTYADGVRQTCTCSICWRRSVRPLGRFCRWCGADMGEDGD
jgi:hypothetical protein